MVRNLEKNAEKGACESVYTDNSQVIETLQQKCDHQHDFLIAMRKEQLRLLEKQQELENEVSSLKFENEYMKSLIIDLFDYNETARIRAYDFIKGGCA